MELPPAPPLNLTADELAAIRAAAALTERDAYFEAHEVLEEAWHPATEPARTLLKGLIHAVVALYQYQRGNSHGARTKYRSARNYLAAYRPIREVAVAALLADLDQFMAPLLALPNEAPPPAPSGAWPRLRLPGTGVPPPGPVPD